MKNSVCVPNQSYMNYVPLLDVLTPIKPCVSLGVTQNCWILFQASFLHEKVREISGIPYCAYFNMRPSLQGYWGLYIKMIKLSPKFTLSVQVIPSQVPNNLSHSCLRISLQQDSRKLYDDSHFLFYFYSSLPPIILTSISYFPHFCSGKGVLRGKKCF